MTVTTTDANEHGLPESFEDIKQLVIQHGELELTISVADANTLDVRGTMSFGAAIAVLPQAANAIKIKKG